MDEEYFKRSSLLGTCALKLNINSQLFVQQTSINFELIHMHVTKSGQLNCEKVHCNPWIVIEILAMRGHVVGGLPHRRSIKQQEIFGGGKFRMIYM